MNVVVFHVHQEPLKRLAFYLESQLRADVATASTVEQMMVLLLGEKSIDLIVVGEEAPTANLFRYLISAGSHIPMIVVGDRSAADRPLNSELSIVGQVKMSEASDELPKMIRNLIKTSSDGRAGLLDMRYCRIGVELLLEVAPLQGDVYVRLSSVKYVKIFRSGVQFTEADLHRLWGVKKIDYLYIDRASTASFLAALQSKLAGVVTRARLDDEAVYATLDQLQETAQDLINKIGFTKEVMALTKAQVDLALKAIGASPRLTRLMERSVLSLRTYTSQHSVMVAHVACAIASQLEWSSETTYRKLILAAFLHDITLPKADHARLRSKAEIAAIKENLTSAEVLAIEHHSYNSSEIVNKLEEVPGDVALIVLQHHERPDGSGFPRGLRAHSIAPLAAVFIAAHDFVDTSLERGDQFEPMGYWEQCVDHYDAGMFKKILRLFLNTETQSAS